MNALMMMKVVRVVTGIMTIGHDEWADGESFS